MPSTSWDAVERNTSSGIFQLVFLRLWKLLVLAGLRFFLLSFLIVSDFPIDSNFHHLLKCPLATDPIASWNSLTPQPILPLIPLATTRNPLISCHVLGFVVGFVVA